MGKYKSKRHKDLSVELIKFSKDRTDPSIKNSIIASKLKVSSMTVSNYTYGNVSDGYLGEDILNLLKKEK